jgi:hypothetical protein
MPLVERIGHRRDPLHVLKLGDCRPPMILSRRVAELREGVLEHGPGAGPSLA